MTKLGFPRDESPSDRQVGGKAESVTRAKTIVGGVYDAGLHYRKAYKGIKLDPFRIAKVYNLNGVQLTILKKVLVTGERGSKDEVQDYKDIINAASRAIEMIEEDLL